MLNDSEIQQLYEWLQRMRRGEIGLYKKEIPGKVVVTLWPKLPQLSRGLIEERIRKGQLHLTHEDEDGIRIYEFKEKN